MRNIRIINNVCVIITDNSKPNLSKALINHVSKHDLKLDKIITTTNTVVYNQDKVYSKGVY